MEENKWIKVTDKLPGTGKCVMIYSKEGGVAEGAYLGTEDNFKQWRWNCHPDNVTHWQPLPKPPKE